jgi:hypothetical protein
MKSNVKVFLRTLAVIMAAALLVSAVTSCIRITGISGSGNVVTEERSVSGFDKVAINAGMNLYLEQGSKEYLKLEAEDNIIQNITTEVKGGKLTVKYKNLLGGINTTEPVNVYLTVINLKELDASSGTSISGKEINTDSLKIDISSGAEGEMIVNANSVDANLSSGSTLKLSGTVENQKVNLSSGVDYRAADLKSKNANISVSSGASARISVSDNLDVNISSGGNVEYSGTPAIVSNISSGGSIKSVGN